MGEVKVGYARVSTDGQDLTAQRDALEALGVKPDRIYVDHGFTGTNRDRPGLREALAACLLRGRRQLRPLAAKAAFGLGDLHALAGPGADEVGLKLSDHRQDVEEEPADGVGRVVRRASEIELDLARGKLVGDVARVRHRPGEPVELGDDQGVAGAHLVDLHRAGRHTGAELAELFNVSRATVYRAVGRAGADPTTEAGSLRRD